MQQFAQTPSSCNALKTLRVGRKLSFSHWAQHVTCRSSALVTSGTYSAPVKVNARRKWTGSARWLAKRRIDDQFAVSFRCSTAVGPWHPLVPCNRRLFAPSSDSRLHSIDSLQPDTTGRDDCPASWWTTRGGGARRQRTRFHAMATLRPAPGRPLWSARLCRLSAADTHCA